MSAVPTSNYKLNHDTHTLLKSVIPSLTFSSHKGQSGRVAVVGGCLHYTGAPYYAGFSALRGGADLCSLACDEAAAIAIKSYSPELMVTPMFDEKSFTIESSKQKKADSENPQYFQNVNERTRNFATDMGRLSALICGPGLGRDRYMLESTAYLIAKAQRKQIPIVLDGDALWILCQQWYIDDRKSTIRGYAKGILTPNGMEFRRLWITHILEQNLFHFKPSSTDYLAPMDTTDLFDQITSNTNDKSLPLSDICYLCQDFTHITHIKDTAQLATKMGLTILRKGAVDIICDGHCFMLVTQPVSPRRCGGQGDVLAGVVGLWNGWVHQCLDKLEASQKQSKAAMPSAPVLAAYAGAIIVRHCAANAFAKMKRSTLTTDLIEAIPDVMEDMFPTTDNSKL